MLDGASQVLSYSPRPIWFIEVVIKDHLPENVDGELNFQETFSLFFSHGYRAFSATEHEREIFLWQLPDILSGKISLGTHNFIFR